jgi:MFS family permease
MKSLASYRLLVPLGLAVCLSLFGDLTLYASLVTRLEVVGLTLAQVGIVLSIHRFIRIPGNPLIGLLMDRFGRRRPLYIVGMLCAVISSALYGLVHGFWPFLVGRLVWGLAWMLINVGGMTMILDVTTQANRGKFTGFYNAWALAGYALGPLIGGYLVDAITFHMAMLACAAISAIGLVVVGLALPETAPYELASADVEKQTQKLGFLPRLQILKQNGLAFLRQNPAARTSMLLYAITQFAGDGIVLSTVALLITSRLGANIPLGTMLVGAATASGTLLAIRSALAAAAGPLAGHLSDGRLGRPLVISASFILGVSGFIVLAFASSSSAILLGVVLGAISSGAALAVLTAYMGDQTPPGKQAIAMGVYATTGDIGSTLGPLIAFALVPLVDIKWVYFFSVFVFIVGLSASLAQTRSANTSAAVKE